MACAVTLRVNLLTCSPSVPFSPVSADSNSASNGPDSAPCSGKSNPIRSADPSSRSTGPTSRGSTMCARSDPGSLASISSVAGSPAKTSPRLAQRLASAVLEAAFGPSSRESLARFDRDSLSWRTSQTSLFAGSTSCSVTLPRSGTMRSGSLSELRISELRTVAADFSWWPTPTRSDGKRCREFRLESLIKHATNHPGRAYLTEHVAADYGGYQTAGFVEWLMGVPPQWTSPVSSDSATPSSRSAPKSSDGSCGNSED